ncbi:chemotaxis protein [Rhodoplanes serenus]|uniref:Chemotaxis protein n=1 Tax=Rhodoplanes serenus TaxID=200615 RepID=A0A9X4XIT4_9BRAD|nr:cache domain-containing protein [Rhodoplanes serenus]MTW15925.1 chemotaxis protein [Rhodoplanes serenus]
MTRRLVSALAIAVAVALPTVVSAAEFGTAAEAKAMIDKAAVTLKDGEAAALAKFNDASGGFRDRDLYVFCFDSKGGAFTAHPNKALVGSDVRNLKEKDGSPLGEKLFAAQQEGTVTTVQYKFPRPGGSDPVPKETYLIKVGGQACGVGYYK